MGQSGLSQIFLDTFMQRNYWLIAGKSITSDLPCFDWARIRDQIYTKLLHASGISFWNQWLGLREILPDTMVFPTKYGGFPGYSFHGPFQTAEPWPILRSVTAAASSAIRKQLGDG